MQVRAEATRRMILDSAVELFDTAGYTNVSLADLITATGISKGAFYYHFANKERVAAAIIGEADTRLRDTTLEILADPASRALGGLIRAVFVIAELENNDAPLRVGIQLRGGLGQISPAALASFGDHRGLFTDVVTAAIAEGDFPADLPAEQVSNTLWAAVLGTHQHCAATGENLKRRLADVLTTLLAAMCTPNAAREYGALITSLTGEQAPQPG